MNMSKGVLIHDYEITTKKVKRKIIYHFGDVHLAEFDASSDDQDKAFAIKRKQQWEEMRCTFAEENGEPYLRESKTSAYAHFLNMLNVASDGDILVLTGDIIDYMSGANLRIINAELEHFSKPFIYVKGNHEETSDTLDGTCLSNINSPVQTFELDDMIIVGIDNSTRNITAEQNKKLKDVLKKGKPILIAMHYPLITDGNKDLLERDGEYNQLNNKNASADVLAFVDIIEQNREQIIAVLAGHLHYMNNSEIAKNVTQYVSSQGALGNINRYKIGV